MREIHWDFREPNNFKFFNFTRDNHHPLFPIHRVSGGKIIDFSEEKYDSHIITNSVGQPQA